MIVIEANIIGALLAFLVGALISAANYAFSRYMLKRHPVHYATTHILRQLLMVAYLVLLLMFGDKTPWDKVWLLVGGALGATLPMIWFTYKLVSLNDSPNEKEDSSDG